MAMILQPITFTATATINRKTHALTMLNLSAAAGMTLTLPASEGRGARYRFSVRTTVTSNNVIILVANSTDVMQGGLAMAQDAADTSVTFETLATSDTISMNGSTRGGTAGDYIELEDVAAGFWVVRGWLTGSGVEVTPFSATV